MHAHLDGVHVLYYAAGTIVTVAIVRYLAKDLLAKNPDSKTAKAVLNIVGI